MLKKPQKTKSKIIDFNEAFKKKKLENAKLKRSISLYDMSEEVRKATYDAMNEDE
ncbi:hypothetical protein [Paenibacillus sp. Soil766]|uniref:hypothetical protein n=1 Tax=Paenibacillus sp. Soil766 TaxID=1736404 RepID=UPI000B2B2231|nr:hypothetical protein [Paenibacillus sp. Soil766]